MASAPNVSEHFSKSDNDLPVDEVGDAFVESYSDEEYLKSVFEVVYPFDSRIVKLIWLLHFKMS